jgi:abequosyltransferase
LTKSAGIILSICIPTLNRGSLIGRTLESILSQVTDEVEVLVVDGGSTDQTKDVVSKFQQDFSAVRYMCSQGAPASKTDPVCPSGAGFDRDCSLAVEMATGEYCWLFTDDDIMKQGAISKVIQATSERYDLVIVNAEVRTADLAQILESSRLRLQRNRVYSPTEWEVLFADTAEYLTFVGGVVIKRDVWRARKKEPYIGTGFIHFGVVFQSALSCDALVIAEPLITIRYGDALYMRTSRYFEIWMFIWPELIWSLPNISDSLKRRMCPKEPWRSKRALLQFRAKGSFSKSEYHKWLRNRFDSRWDRIVTRLIASLPGSAVNFLAIVRYHQSGKLPGQFLVDLVKSPFYFGRVFTSSRSLSEVRKMPAPQSHSNETSAGGLG